MRKILLIPIFFIAIVNILVAQENIVTLSGGYAFSNIQDSDKKATGYRINGLYEFNPMQGQFVNGVSFGYIHIKADGDFSESIMNSFPIYYVPKFTFGNEKIKAFVKGAIGVQFASLKRTGIIEVSDTDFGFYGGGGGGLMFFIKENIFINAEYEIAWVSNAWYKDGWVNSVMGGIGYRF